MQRTDDFKERQEHISHFSDEEIHRYFWELAQKIVAPLIDLAKNYTSPSIERSILLRMGFNSLEAKAIVNLVKEKGFLVKGAGHIVWKIAKKHNLGIREAGLSLVDGKYWDSLEFKD